jgi:hypothetical protein
MYDSDSDSDLFNFKDIIRKLQSGQRYVCEDNDVLWRSQHSSKTLDDFSLLFELLALRKYFVGLLTGKFRSTDATEAGAKMGFSRRKSLQLALSQIVALVPSAQGKQCAHMLKRLLLPCTI